jgi:hypothetical protein
MFVNGTEDKFYSTPNKKNLHLEIQRMVDREIVSSVNEGVKIPICQNSRVHCVKILLRPGIFTVLPW